MARFVSFHDGLVGSLQRTLELGRRLQAAGHDVLLASPSDVVADAVRAGVDAVHLGRLDELRADLDDLPRPGRDTRSPVDVVRWLRAGWAARRASLADDSVERVIREFEPDLVLVEIEYHLAAIRAMAAGAQVVLTTGFFSTLPGPGRPPLDSTLRPSTAAEEEIADAWRATIAGHHRTRRRAIWSPSGLAAPFRPVRPVTWNPLDLRAVARAVGVDLHDVMHDDQWLRPFALDRLPIVSFTPAALEFGDGGGDRWHTVGSMLPPPDRAIDHMSDDDTRRLVAFRRRREEDQRPLLFVCLGTYWGNGAPLLRTIVDAVRTRTELDVVIGLGGVTDRAALEPTPEHVTVLDWAPQAELLAEADLAIVHGGVTTITECASAGVPMICCSTHTNEQDGNVARAVEAGIARALGHRSLTADAVAAAIDDVLADDDARSRSGQVADEIEAERSDERAITTLESFVGGVTR